MEKKTFRTIVKRGELNNEMYAFGMIHGLEIALCDLNSPTLGLDCEMFNNYVIYTTNTTEEKYKLFRETVAKIYPKLSIHSYEV